MPLIDLQGIALQDFHVWGHGVSLSHVWTVWLLW